MAVGVIAFLMFVIILLPATSVVGMASLPTGFAYSSVKGTTWRLEFENAALMNRPIGMLTIEPSLMSIFGPLGGRATARGRDLSFTASFAQGNGLSVQDLDLTSRLRGRIALASFDGAVRVTGEELSFDKAGRCLSANGTLRTNAFETIFAGLGMSRDAVATPIACQGGLLTATFGRAFAGGTLAATAQLTGPSEVALDLLLRFDDQAAIPEQMTEWLQANGFVASAAGWQAKARVAL